MDPKERKIWIVVALLLAAAIGYVAWSMYGASPDAGKPPQDRGPIQHACTMEAKQCPDGSYVGRQGPKCEFAPCPGPEVEVQVK
jgi:Flp pilus assembly protein CpaB